MPDRLTRTENELLEAATEFFRTRRNWRKRKCDRTAGQVKHTQRYFIEALKRLDRVEREYNVKGIGSK